ncbi:Putative aldehyde dehydrogenase AldA [Thalassovita gelatinovora]|uniref:Putative aldehyde dehydrogenase AldA n=1 Tax=Thalassovita gelatinovora TaxID=53501 RepID=A0A0P1F5T3_THAGE|nr:aldehyde dehydrogenase family protein [Thalassovita gelatinovora]QIZ80848.1 aldehyde dehydrogenase family protein [Thalassovita gelatinovora]CUH63284.1 Putative aldehyde dehydrogenase AldA [Thalassovita gelatinovora]SEQ64596.1 aldehyde dehydrogenase (NAD+) [Thalassovita gelatinovora]
MTVKDIFETMEYGPAPESAAEALAWLVDQGDRFGHFIDGHFTAPGDGFTSKNPANGEVLATLTQATQGDVNAAVTAARKAQPKWEKLGGHGRAKHLYAIARLLQKHARLFAVLETLDNGKPIRESRDIDVPLVQRHFYFHAGMAQLMDSELPDREAVGVCGQIIPWNFPLLMLAWKVAPALAMGNTVVLKPAEYTSLTALLFADICRKAGLPKGVVNVVTGDGAVGEMIVEHPDIDKIAFTGSTEVGRKIRQATAGSGKALTLELGGKSPYIVFDDADLDSAIEGLVDAIWFNQGQVCCAGSRLLVQEGIAGRFYDKLKVRMDKLRIGNPMDKCIDMGALADPVQLQTVRDMVEGCQDGEIHRVNAQLPAEGCFYPPTLITGLEPSHRLMQEEIFGPVLVSTTFRTPAEAVALANNSRYGLAATVWTENVNLALDIAPKLAAGVVWVNATNLFDAAAGFGGVRESGYGREGGWEGLQAYTKAKGGAKPIKPVLPYSGDRIDAEHVDRTAKLYIGGKQARPDGGYSRDVWSKSGKHLGEVPIASRKDIRNAVEAARGAAGWSKTTGHLRAQILYYIAENLSARADEFAQRIDSLSGHHGAKEVEASIRRLFTYAAWADKYDGQAKGVPIRGVALSMREPVGVIGAICPDEAPLLGLVSLMAPAIAMGNRVVLAASESMPLAATDFYQVLDTSDVPGGVVNILTGPPQDLAKTLAQHLDVDAVWSFSSSDISGLIERESAGNLKRSWVNNGMARDWMSSDGEGRAFLNAATEVKTIWVPYGE